MEIRSLDFSFTNDGNILKGLIQTESFSHVLGNTKKWREVISKDVFSRAIQRAFDNGRDIDFISDHDDSKILASTKNNSLTLEEDDQGLHVMADIVETSWGKDILALVKSGIITGLSFGMQVNQQRWSKCEDGIDLRIIDDIDLFEVSAVRNPAYPLTNLESRGIEVDDIEFEHEGEDDMEDLKALIENLSAKVEALEEKLKDKKEEVAKDDEKIEDMKEERQDPVTDSKETETDKTVKFDKETFVEVLKEALKESLSIFKEQKEEERAKEDEKEKEVVKEDEATADEKDKEEPKEDEKTDEPSKEKEPSKEEDKKDDGKDKEELSKLKDFFNKE